MCPANLWEGCSGLHGGHYWCSYKISDDDDDDDDDDDVIS